MVPTKSLPGPGLSGPSLVPAWSLFDPYLVHSWYLYGPHLDVFKNLATFDSMGGRAHAVMYDRKVFCRQLGEKLFIRKIVLTLLVWYHNTPFLQF